MGKVKEWNIELMNEGVCFMPDKPRRFCMHPGCSNLTLSYKCDQHKSDERDRKRFYDKNCRPDYRKLYNTRMWEKIREFILSRSPFCVACMDIGIIEVATDIDHIVDHNGNPVLFWDTNNLQALCHKCHSSKTAKTKGFAKGK